MNKVVLHTGEIYIDKGKEYLCRYKIPILA